MPLPNEDQSRESKLDRTYRRFVLTMVTVGFTLNFLDRQLLSILLQPIKQELHVSDSMLGLLAGLAFAVFYATLGIPISRLADRGSKRTLMSVSIGVWSVATVFCGLARSFWQLLLARIGVGVGEAGFTPSGLAMISDYFPKSQRGFATGVVNTGPMFGTMLGLLIGGWLANDKGWRIAFALCGIPGIVFALLFWLTIRDPVKASTAPKPAQPRFIESMRGLWRLSAYRYVLLGSALSAFGLYGEQIWMPSFLTRSHGLSLRAIGSTLGPLTGILGGLGIMLGGWLTDVLSRRRQQAIYWIPTIASILSLPPLWAALMFNNYHSVLSSYGVAFLFSVIWVAPTFVVIQSLVPNSVRVTALAWKLLLTNLIGLGLGPQAVGFISDSMKGHYGVESLRGAMMVASVSLLLAPVFYLLAARSAAQSTPNAAAIPAST